MKKIDDVFIDDDGNDPLGAAPAVKGKKQRERIVGEFYQVSKGWADKALYVSGYYSLLALRLYWYWRGRPLDADTIAVTARALAGPGYSRSGRARMLERLDRAGLIEIVEVKNGRAPRVRVIDPQLQL